VVGFQISPMSSIKKISDGYVRPVVSIIVFLGVWSFLLNEITPTSEMMYEFSYWLELIGFAIILGDVFFREPLTKMIKAGFDSGMESDWDRRSIARVFIKSVPFMYAVLCCFIAWMWFLEFYFTTYGIPVPSQELNIGEFIKCFLIGSPLGAAAVLFTSLFVKDDYVLFAGVGFAAPGLMFGSILYWTFL